jgi:hypothetical protein
VQSEETAVRTLPPVVHKVALEFPLPLQQQLRIRVLLDTFSSVVIDDDQFEAAGSIESISGFKTQKSAMPFKEPHHSKSIGV